MIYGLWLSATGVTTNSHQVDVIANNLANAETSGFRRELATFRERSPEAKERGTPTAPGDRLFDNIGGGQLLSPSTFDSTSGDLEQTGKNLDCAVAGDGYFLVQDPKGNERLTRNGSFQADREGNLVLSMDAKTRVLDTEKQPIKLDPDTPISQIEISDDGEMRVGNQVLGKIGLFNVADEKLLRPVGNTLFKAPASVEVSRFNGQIESGYLEKSNVDPAVELTKLMEAQRMLDANANLIRTQDQSLARLVNDVGKIS